jgi:hypothetical protein
VPVIQEPCDRLSEAKLGGSDVCGSRGRNPGRRAPATGAVPAPRFVRSCEPNETPSRKSGTRLARWRRRRRCNGNHLGEGLSEGQSVDPYQSLNSAPQNYALDNSGMKSWTTLLCALRLSALTACA